MTTIYTKINFDDGDALSESVYLHDRLIGAIWTYGEDCGWEARAMSNIAGYWNRDIKRFQTREAALAGLLHQAAFEKRLRAQLEERETPVADPSWFV